MRIAVYHNQPSGGARRGLHGFCQILGRRHRLDVFTLSTADQEMLQDEAVAASVTRLPFSFRPPVIHGLYLNDFRRRQSFRDLDRVNALAAELIDRGGYDVALIDACRFTFAPTVLATLRTPSAYYLHHRPRDPHDTVWAPPMSRYEWLRRLWRLPFERSLERGLWLQDRRMVRLASGVVTNSSFTRDRIRRIYGVDAFICPYGVDLPPASGRSSGGYVLSVGELERRKGFDLVVEALGLLPPRARPPLHIVANQVHPRVRLSLERQATELNVDLTIRVLPSQAQLAHEYGDALVFAYGAHEEALGLAPLEAMSYAIPVVAVGEGGVLETIEHGRTGLLTSRDPAEFAWRLGVLLDDAALRRRLGGNARAIIAERWRWTDHANALEAYLVRLAEGRVAA